MRNMSVSLTEEAVVARRKTVTRRRGWCCLKVGDRVQLCRKVMGRKKGEPLVRIVVVEIVSTRWEPLRKMTDEVEYGLRECELEGFGNDPRLRWPSAFVEFFCASHGRDCTPETLVNRIEWRYV